MRKRSWVFALALVLGLAPLLFAQKANRPNPISPLPPGVQLRSTQRELPANTVNVALPLAARSKQSISADVANKVPSALGRSLNVPASRSRVALEAGLNKVELRLPAAPSRRSLEAGAANSNRLPGVVAPANKRNSTGDR